MYQGRGNRLGLNAARRMTVATAIAGQRVTVLVSSVHRRPVGHTAASSDRSRRCAGMGLDSGNVDGEGLTVRSGGDASA